MVYIEKKFLDIVNKIIEIINFKRLMICTTFHLIYLLVLLFSKFPVIVLVLCEKYIIKYKTTYVYLKSLETTRLLSSWPKALGFIFEPEALTTIIGAHSLLMYSVICLLLMYFVNIFLLYIFLNKNKKIFLNDYFFELQTGLKIFFIKSLIFLPVLILVYLLIRNYYVFFDQSSIELLREISDQISNQNIQTYRDVYVFVKEKGITETNLYDINLSLYLLELATLSDYDYSQLPAFLKCISKEAFEYILDWSKK